MNTLSIAIRSKILSYFYLKMRTYPYKKHFKSHSIVNCVKVVWSSMLLICYGMKETSNTELKCFFAQIQVSVTVVCLALHLIAVPLQV